MTDKVISLIRTYVPIWTAAALVWLASALDIVIPEEGATGVILVVVAVAQGLWYALIRWLEPRLPSWLRVVLIGSTKQPAYPSRAVEQSQGE